MQFHARNKRILITFVAYLFLSPSLPKRVCFPRRKENGTSNPFSCLWAGRSRGKNLISGVSFPPRDSFRTERHILPSSTNLGEPPLYSFFPISPLRQAGHGLMSWKPERGFPIHPQILLFLCFSVSLSLLIFFNCVDAESRSTCHPEQEE